MGARLMDALMVALVVHTAFFHLWRIARLRPYLDVRALTTLVHALVILRLDHCNTLYVGLPLRLMRKLQVVQNEVARLLTGVRKCQHISLTLATLHWLPIRFRIDFKVLMLTYKALNQACPTCGLRASCSPGQLVMRPSAFFYF